VVEQWPIVGREDLYYGGTTYENSQGLGVQLAPSAQRGESVPLGWAQPAGVPGVESGGLLAVPVTRLYDRGRTVLPSHLLRLRIPEPFVALNPADAARLGVQEGGLVEVRLAGAQAPARAGARLDEHVPAGALLVPRSLGIPIWGPGAAEVSVVEKVMAG
jgi:NADH-quinone oxidoreductase subunit G